jgi:ketosteroid isomerase-like protein
VAELTGWTVDQLETSREPSLPARNTARAMSQENVEVIRRSVEHFNRAGEPARDLFDPEISFTTRGDIESSSTYTGLDGLQEAVSGFARVWDSIRWEIQKVIGGDDTFVIVFRFHLRGKGSGVELETDEAWATWMRDGKFIRIEQYGDLHFNYWLVSTYRNGKVIRSEWFVDRAEALEAAGLKE